MEQRQQAAICEKCKSPLMPISPAFPPQIANGPGVSVVALLRSFMECTNALCKTKYGTVITAANLQVKLEEIKEQSRILVPDFVPPGLK